MNASDLFPILKLETSKAKHRSNPINNFFVFIPFLLYRFFLICRHLAIHCHSLLFINAFTLIDGFTCKKVVISFPIFNKSLKKCKRDCHLSDNPFSKDIYSKYELSSLIRHQRCFFFLEQKTCDRKRNDCKNH